MSPSPRRSLLAAGLTALSCLPAASSAQSPEDRSRPTLYYIPHTHWEGAVFQTRAGYLEQGLPNLLEALRLLQRYPDYKFTVDQVAYFKPLLERYPEVQADFRRFIAQGRLEIAGGMDVMPDDVKPGGELFVRQMQYGKLYCREKLGVEVPVAWFLDTFGHHPQMPQLLKLAGYTSFWFCRGVPRDDLPSEFRWRGIDGTEIPAVWLPGFYGLFYGPPRQPDAFAQFFQRRFDSLAPHARGPERAGLAGADVSTPEDYVPPLIAQFNRQPGVPFQIRYSVPSEFARVVARRADLPVLTNDFDPIFQGTYSSRIELKQTTRRLEQKLLTAEKLCALTQWLGESPDPALLWRAWEPVLFNQTHDLASGVMTDRVYDDTVRSYAFSERLADELVETHLQTLLRQIDTRGDGLPIVVFNPLGWRRTDVAEVEVGFVDPGVKALDLLDAAGRTAPIQWTRVERDSDGSLKRVRLVFLAREVPALGYSTYRLVARTAGAGPADDTAARQRDGWRAAVHQSANGSPPSVPELVEDPTGNVLENEHYRLTFNRATGELISVFDKSQAWEVLSGPGNVIARQDDHGDLWELYRGLDGASHIAMTNQQPVPTAATARLSSEFSDKPGRVRRGPVFSEFTVAHRFGSGTFATRVRLYAGLRRIEFQTELVNREKYVRYQALFPTSLPRGRYVQEIPFGALERPAAIEFPAQNWVDYSDDRRGVGLVNFGLPGNLVTDGTLMLSLLRSHNLGHYGFGGGYEPGMSSETGFEIGKTLTFRYALIPHPGDWRQAALYREGQQFSCPLIVRKTRSHPGPLPARWGLLDLSPPNVLLTACKPGPNHTTVIRVYEAAGQATTAISLNLHATPASAHEANLLEDSGRPLPLRNNTVRFALHAFEIKTIACQLVPEAMSRSRVRTR